MQGSDDSAAKMREDFEEGDTDRRVDGLLQLTGGTMTVRLRGRVTEEDEAVSEECEDGHWRVQEDVSVRVVEDWTAREEDGIDREE